MRPGSLPTTRTKASVDSTKGSTQRTLWFVVIFFSAGYALSGLQKLFGGGINYSLDVSEAFDASGQHATGHQLHAGAMRAGACACASCVKSTANLHDTGSSIVRR